MFYFALIFNLREEMQMEKQPRLLSIREAALHLGVEYRQLLISVSNGSVPHYRLHKSIRLVDPNEVVDIMKHTGGDHE